MKRVILGIIIIFLFLSFLFITKYHKTVHSTEYKNKKYLSHLEEKFDYYLPSYAQRYIDYKQTHLNMSDEDIVTRINLNLDKEFYTNTIESLYKNTNYILINKFFYVTKDYIPDNLKEMTMCTKGNIYLVEEALTNFNTMCQDMKKESLQIRAISAYRDYNYQLNLYNKYLINDTKKNVDTYSARPGHSEHQSGLTVDVDNISSNFNDFESTDEFIWMQENAYKYGFILRYPKGKQEITGYSYESWHYRYVGKKIASYIKKHNITFDEYYARFIDNKY